MQASDSIQQLTPDRCPDRRRLAEAIETRNSALTAVDVARDAVVRGRDVVAAAEERLEAARAATSASRAQRAQELAHVAEGGTTALASPTRKARALDVFSDEDGARLGERRAWQRARAADAARQVRNEGFDGEIADAVERHLSQALQNIYEAEKGWTLASELEAWREARTALMENPDAPLPA
jgi:hypothetical protein